MTQISFDVPDEAIRAACSTPDRFAADLRLAAAAFWYGRVEISQERAAQIAGLNRGDFLLALAERKIDSVVIDFDDLDRELARDRATHG